MKLKIFGSLILLLFCSGLYRAQLTVHKLVSAGYVYQNGSFGELGGKLLFLKNDDFIFRLGAGAMLGSVDGGFAVLPKVQGDILVNFERNVDLYHSYYFLSGAELTSKYIAPKIGFSLFGLIDLTGGYAFPFGDKGLNGKEMKGLNVNVTFNVPTVLIHDLLN